MSEGRGWVSRQDASRLIEESIKASRLEDDPGGNRRWRRVQVKGGVACSMGRVLDISRGGLRVLSKKKASGEGLIEVASAKHHAVVTARVVWCHKVAFRKYVLGLEFVNLTREQTRAVSEIAAAA